MTNKTTQELDPKEMCKCGHTRHSHGSGDTDLIGGCLILTNVGTPA